MAEITLTEPRFLEAKVAPVEDDILFVGSRRELVVGNIPPSSMHGHLIKTVHRTEGKIIEQTYRMESRDREYRLTILGSAEGPNISDSYENSLNKSGL